MAVIMDMLDEKDVVEGDMVITHINFPAGTEYLWQIPVYTLQTNVHFYPRNKITLFNK